VPPSEPIEHARSHEKVVCQAPGALCQRDAASGTRAHSVRSSDKATSPESSGRRERKQSSRSCDERISACSWSAVKHHRRLELELAASPVVWFAKVVPMKRRLRKKKHLGEFQELGFELHIYLSPSVTTDEVDALWDRLIELIESRRLGFGGGGAAGELRGFAPASRDPRSSRLERAPTCGSAFFASWSSSKSMARRPCTNLTSSTWKVSSGNAHEGARWHCTSGVRDCSW
jgi:uncharacterized protein YggL (DUF469 family)